MSGEEDPEFSRMTVNLLKSWLTEHNVALPPQNEKKSYYVQLATQTKKRLAAAPAVVPPKSPRTGAKRVRAEAPTPAAPAVAEKQSELTSQIKKRKPATSSASIDLGKRHGLDDQEDREDAEVEGKRAVSKRRHTIGGEEKKEATPAANRRAVANADITPARPTHARQGDTPAATSFKVSLPVSPAPASPLRPATPPVNEFQSPARQAGEGASPKRQSTRSNRKASPLREAPGGNSTPRKLSYDADLGRGLAPAAPAPRPQPLRADQLPEVPGARLERLATKPAAAPVKRAPAKAPAKSKGTSFSGAASLALAKMAPFLKYGLLLVATVVIGSMLKEQLTPTIVFCDANSPRADCTPCPTHGSCASGVLKCDPLFERDGWFGKGVDCKPNSQLKYFQQKVYELSVTKAGLDVCTEYATKNQVPLTKDVPFDFVKSELAGDRYLAPEIQHAAWASPANYVVSGGLELSPTGHEVRVARSLFVYPFTCTVHMWVTDHLPELLATCASTLVCLVLVWKRLQHRALLSNASDIATRIKGILQDQRAQSETNPQIGAAVPKDQLRSQLVHDHSVADDDSLWKEIDRILSRDARLETVSIPLNGRQTDAYMWSAAVPAGAPRVNAGAGFSWS